MFLYSTKQTLISRGCTTYPFTEESVQYYDPSMQYEVGDMVQYKHDLYISLKTQTGVEPPILGDSWTYYDKLSVYRPLQIEPTRYCQSTKDFNYCVTMRDCTHLLILGGFGFSITVEELDSDNNTIATSSQLLDKNYNKYLFELQNKTGEQKIRATFVSNSTDEYTGLSLIKGCVEYDLGESECVGCLDKRVYVQEPSKYVGGVKVYGSDKVVSDNNISIEFDNTKKDILLAIFENLLDTPVFITKSKATQSDVNDGIYGYYGYYNLKEDCTTGTYIATGTLKSFPYTPPQAIKKEICTPKVFGCDGNPSTIATKSPSFIINEFCYEGAIPLTHHSTDWELYDSSNNLVSSRSFETGIFKYRNTWRQNSGDTYTVRARVRANNGNVSQWGSRTITEPDSNCAGLCKDPFNDGSLRFLLHLSQGANDEYDQINGGKWVKNNVIVTNASDGCNTTHYSDISAICEADDIATIQARFDSSEITQITICTFGYVPDEAHYKYPLVLRWGSLIVAISPIQSVDSYSGGVIWLESNKNRGNGSSPLQLNHPFEYAFHQWTITADLIKRTVKFYEDDVLIRAFYNVDDGGTSNNFSDKYDIGVTARSGLRGALRELAIFDRELSMQEIEYIRRAIF